MRDLNALREKLQKLAYQDPKFLQLITEEEQALVSQGVSEDELKDLCQLHLSVQEEQRKKEQEEEKRAQDTWKSGLPKGHPVLYFLAENEALSQRIQRAKSSLSEGRDLEAIRDQLLDFKRIKLFYGKKEESIMPLLERYGIPGPTNVMWGVDDKIKQDLGRLAKSLEKGLQSGMGEDLFDAQKEEIADVYERMEGMIYKEENILLPMSMEHFSQEEWFGIYEDLWEMGPVFIGEIDRWEEAERFLEAKRAARKASLTENGMITFAQGKMSVAQLEALFDLLPIDITFIDADDVNQFFSNQGKVFARPKSALGRKVYDCHPARIRPVVENLIQEFKEGRRDSYERWIPNPFKPVKISYLAVRSEEGEYLGTLELVQDFAKTKKQLKRFKED